MKLRPPCELVVRSVLPAFRSLVAKKLIEKYHFSQVAAAEKLGTTQAAISHYLYSKRGDKRMKQLEASSSVRSIVDEIAEGIATEKFSPLDAMLHFCKLCRVLRTRDLICDWHKNFLAVPEACDVCPPAIKG
ncbi:MAG: transcriptional regulator [Candidatus Bathyarchaeia archaeon]